jgi:hypothetical protein
MVLSLYKLLKKHYIIIIYLLLFLVILVILLRLRKYITTSKVQYNSIETFSDNNNDTSIIIVPDLIGGIGNQLFVYASALVLSKMYNIPIVLDNRKDIYSYGENRPTYNDTIFYNVKKNDMLELKEFINSETTYLIDENKFKNILDKYNENEKENIPNNTKIVYLTGGYYQEYSYFNKYREDILEILKPSMDINIKVDKLFKKNGINASDKLVGLHIRLLDIYTPDTPEKRVYDDEEYENIINDLTNFPLECKFIILSNNIDECMKKINSRNISIDQSRLIYISNKDYIELAILSRCNDYIASPSTFCWWGLYLNSKPLNDKKIYIYWKQDSDYRIDFYKKYTLYPNLINKFTI